MSKITSTTRAKLYNAFKDHEMVKIFESFMIDTRDSLPSGISSAKILAQDGVDKAIIADNKAVTADNKATTADGKAVAADSKAVAATNQVQVEKPTSLTPTITLNDNFKLTLSLKPTNATLTSCAFNLPTNKGIGHTISITTTSAITTVTFSPAVTGAPTSFTANQSFKFTWDGDEWITIL